MSTNSPTTRPSTPSDFDSVATLVHRSHTISFAPYASAAWVESRNLNEYRLKWKSVLADESEDAITLVSVSDDSIVGTVHVSPLDSPEFDAQLNGMHVDPDQTGRGIGGLLMTAAIAFIIQRRFKRVELGVIAANNGARRFYEKHGWVLNEELPDGIEGVPIAIYALTVENLSTTAS